MSPSVKHVEGFLHWDGGLAAVAYPLGVTFLYGNNFLMARVLFTVSAVLLAARAISASQQFKSNKSKAVCCTVGILVAMALWVGSSFWVSYKESQPPKPEFLLWLWSYLSWITQLPFRRIGIAGLVVGLISISVMVLVKLWRDRCPDKRLHALVEDDKAAIRNRVRIPGIIYKPYFEAKPPYIEIGFSVFNNSLYDIVIDNSVGGTIRFGEDHTEFEYSPPKIKLNKPYCVSRDDTFFDVRQAVTEQEIKLFRENPEMGIRLDALEVTFRVVGPSPVVTARLDTSNCYLNTKERMWRAWDHLEFVFRWTDEQWALLSSRSPKELAALQTATPAPPAALPTAQSAPAKPEPREPNIVYVPVEMTEAHREHGGTIREGRGPYSSISPRQQDWFRVCLAGYRNTVLKDRQIGGRGNVSAVISYVFEEQLGLATANRAAWFGNSDFRITFGINDTHVLVVATFENGQLYAIHESPTWSAEDRTKKVPLMGDLHKVHIELISESESKVICTTDLMLEVTRKPEFNIRLERPASWKRRKLYELAQAGRELVYRYKAAEPDTRDSFEQEIEAWRVRALAFVIVYLNGSYKARFDPPPYVAPPGRSTPFQRLAQEAQLRLGLDEKTLAKVELLETFRNEVT